MNNKTIGDFLKTKSKEDLEKFNIIKQEYLVNIPNEFNQDMIGLSKLLDYGYNLQDLAEYVDSKRLDMIFFMEEYLGATDPDIDWYRVYYQNDKNLTKEQKKNIAEREKFAIQNKKGKHKWQQFSPHYLKFYNEQKHFTLEEKIKYYKKRVNDKKLTSGQRWYAKNFLKQNERKKT